MGKIFKAIIVGTILIIIAAVLLVALIFGLQFLFTLVPCEMIAYVTTILLLVAVAAIILLLIVYTDEDEQSIK